MLHKAYFCNLEGLQGANTRKVPHAHRLQKRFVKQQKHKVIFCNGDLQGENSRKILMADKLQKMGGHLPRSLPRLVWFLRTSDPDSAPAHVSVQHDSEESVVGTR